MAGRFHHKGRIVKPARRLYLLAWAVCATAIAAGALRGQEDADPVPPVRLLYGTRRVRIDVPRRPLPPAARPVESWPIPRHSIIRSDPPALPIDDDESRPVDEPLLRPRLGGWQPVPPQERPAEADVSSPDDADAASEPDLVAAPARDEFAPPDDDDGQETSEPPLQTSDPVRPGTSSAATAPDGGSPSADSRETPIPRQRMERPDQPPRNEGWRIVTFAPAVGTTLGVMLGILFSTLLTLLFLKRFAGQLDRVVRVELINGFPSAPQWGAGLPQPPSAEARPSQPGGPEFAAAEFGELILPLQAAGPTWDDERQAALREQRLAEEAILKSIYDDNVELRECLAALANTA